jgi:acyl-CoA dehydrogenase
VDFELSEEQQAVVELAERIVSDKATPTHLRTVEEAAAEAGAERLDEATWTALVDAGLVALCLPEADGGSGFGILEACLVLDQIGRHVTPVPYLPAVVGGAMALAAAGTPDQRAELLGGVADGSSLVIPALGEPGSYVVPDRPATVARSGADGHLVLDGEKWFVPWAARATHLLVPATLDDGTVAVLVVPADAEGIEREALDTTSGWPESIVRFAGTTVPATAVLGGSDADGAAIVADTVRRLTVGVCALQAGVSEGALRLTATYTSERHQFGVPIATFQAVAQRAADAYIDTQGVRSTMLQAAWRLAEGLPADDAVHVAKYWATEGAQRVALAAQHLHAGIGVDTDYPLHRHYLVTRHLDLTLGGATEHLRALGARLAATG